VPSMMLNLAVCAYRRLLFFASRPWPSRGKRLTAAVCNENHMNAHSHMARRAADLHGSPYQRAWVALYSGLPTLRRPLSAFTA
jgi:hypothetical protein